MLKLVIFLCCALYAGLCPADDVQAQLDAQQRTMLMMQNNLQQMQTDLQAVNGQLEELRHELQQLREQQVKSTVEEPGVTPPVFSGTKTTPEEKSAPAETQVAPKTAAEAKNDPGKQAYDQAYALVNQHDLTGAEQSFSSFIEHYPEHQYLPNAWYWLGQVQFKLGSYDKARVSFLNAAKYQDSPKRPDALFKLGKITEQLGDKEKARRYYEVLIKTYPEDTSAVLAKKELEKL